MASPAGVRSEQQRQRRRQRQPKLRQRQLILRQRVQPAAVAVVSAATATTGAAAATVAVIEKMAVEAASGELGRQWCGVSISSGSDSSNTCGSDGDNDSNCCNSDGGISSGSIQRRQLRPRTDVAAEAKMATVAGMPEAPAAEGG